MAHRKSAIVPSNPVAATSVISATTMIVTPFRSNSLPTAAADSIDTEQIVTKTPKPRESIRKSLLLIKEEIDPKIAPGEHIMEVKVKEPKAPLVPVVVEVKEVKEVKPRESIRKSLLLIKEEIDPKIAPGEHIMEVKVKEPKAPFVPVVVVVKEVKEVKPRASIRASLILMKDEIDPKIAPGEHIMEVKVKEPKAPAAPAVVEVKEVKEVKPRESIRKSLLLIKEEIDPKIAPGEHIMEVKVKEPKAPVAPAVVEVKEVREVKPRASIRASLILKKKDIDPSVAPGEHIMEVKVKEPPSSISSLSASPAVTLSAAQDLGPTHSTSSFPPPAAIQTTAAARVEPSTSSGVMAWMKSFF